eukprot:m.99145 g.99145  ORF g.99145 m.99145 type:complete len:702 (-) comp22154_c1_seq7:155-2260(-)
MGQGMSLLRLCWGEPSPSKATRPKVGKPPAAYLNIEESQAENVFHPTDHAKSEAHIKSLTEYKQMYDQSIDDPETFWGEIARTFYWEKEWDPATFHQYNYDRRKGKVEISWFVGGKTNMCYNCVDKHVKDGNGDRVAFYWEGNDPSAKQAITYLQLQDRVSRFANVLKDQGVTSRDVVCIYMPMILELVVAMLACARIGAMHSIVFGGFSAEALSDRIVDCKSPVLVTADGSFRGKKFVALKSIVDAAIARCTDDGFEVKTVIVAKNVGDTALKPTPWTEGRDLWFHELEENASPTCEPEWVDAEHPLFLLYTSGSTGRPKGVLHTTGGYMVWTATTFKYSFDYHPEDIYWCTADIGWITGHSYITYGPLLNCASSVMFEGVPTFPDAGRFWNIVQDYKVNSFYTAPTAIRALQREGDDIPKKYDLSSLRVLGTVGEPINPEAWMWYYDVIGQKRCSIVDTWWQTETGGHMLTGLPGCTPMKPGSASLPMFGVVPALLDEEGMTVQGRGTGFLVITQPWPGQMRTVYGDHERFEQTYFGRFAKYYISGDGCTRDEDGYYWVTGRTDDVINTSGHRIGTAELEGSMAKHPAVVEAAIVAFPHPIKGQGIYAYVILRPGNDFTEDLEKSLKEQIRNEIGPFATPDVIHNATGLPKTRSGKIMRRILRKIAAGTEAELGDISTLADPPVVEALIASRPAKNQKS